MYGLKARGTQGVKTMQFTLQNLALELNLFISFLKTFRANIQLQNSLGHLTTDIVTLLASDILLKHLYRPVC